MISISSRDAIRAFCSFQWWLTIRRFQIKLNVENDNNELTDFAGKNEAKKGIVFVSLTRCSSARCELGGKPTQARRMFSIAAR